MIDFDGVSAIRIPEGSVVKITNAQGVVLWEKPQTDEEYTPLPYLMFNANMVFDTGVICNTNTKIEIEFTRESSSSKYLYGVRTSDNKASVTAYLASSGAWRFGGTYRNFTLSNSTTTVHSAIVSKTNIVIDGTTYKYVGTVGTFTCPYTLTIGSARTTSGAVSSPSFVGKLYTFKMYDGSNLIRDYVPVTNSAGVSGLYDNVNGEFIAPL